MYFVLCFYYNVLMSSDWHFNISSGKQHNHFNNKTLQNCKTFYFAVLVTFMRLCCIFCSLTAPVTIHFFRMYGEKSSVNLLPQKKVIRVWNHMRVRKWWKNLHFWVNYAFKCCILCGKELQNSVRHLFSPKRKSSSSSTHQNRKNAPLYYWNVTYHCLHLTKHQFSPCRSNP